METTKTKWKVVKISENDSHVWDGKYVPSAEFPNITEAVAAGRSALSAYVKGELPDYPGLGFLSQVKFELQVAPVGTPPDDYDVVVKEFSAGWDDALKKWVLFAWK